VFVMNWKIIVAVMTCPIIAMPAVTHAQGAAQAQAIASSDVLSQISMFAYRDGPKSELFFRGTPLAALAEGKGRVEYQDGNARISVKVKKLPEPASLGPYTTYILWALTPDGRPVNQGVLAGFEGGKGEIDTQYGASQFALIVTAEPHFAVSVPSSMVVLYNVADDVEGTETKVKTLTERANYSSLARIAIDSKTNTPEIVQARYAVAIAGTAGAERFAAQDYATARDKLTAAQTALRGKRSERRTAPGLAREAVIAGEDARRAALLASTAAAGESERLAAVNAGKEAVAEATAQAAAAASRAAAAANTASELAAEAATQTERQRSAGVAAATARTDLRNRLNMALPTRESDRGLISEVGGVQFPTGTANISALARENLSKLSGIVASYPSLRFSVEGHTDNTGSVATNNDLSLRRAMSVRDYLIGQGVAASSIDVVGFGSSNPIADNSTADARARNRRVEIVLSGGPLAAL
jgi:outer membrane protein OmpA-like peptidoglycan-associated protein